MKENIFAAIDTYREDMTALADAIYDHPELALKETFAAGALCGYLEKKGLSVERGTGGLETAFRTAAGNGEGGPSIGLLAEYDALPGVHHACGHHMQGPVMLAAFLALRDGLPKDRPWTLVLYGTPGEEGGGGKVIMAEKGSFRDIDVALMMHGGDKTTYDPVMSATVTYTVRYENPALGAAFDALLLAMDGVELMREHMADSARVHYAPAPAGWQNAEASGAFMLRSMRDADLDDMIRRFAGIVEGAAKMTGSGFTMTPGIRLGACFPNQPLADLFYENAREAHAPRIAPPRGTMGSTDFGNVMGLLPGFCARVAFAPEGTGAHSLEWAKAGKSAEAHDCILTGAKIIAGMAWDIVTREDLLPHIRADHAAELAKSIS